MLRRFLMLCWLLLPLPLLAEPDLPRVSIASVRGLEKGFDAAVRRMDVNDPAEVMSAAQGFYLDNYGAVFTMEVNLVTAGAVRPSDLSKPEVTAMNQRKLRRVPQLKSAVMAMMVRASAALDNVPVDQRVTVVVNLFYFRWEDQTGLPQQIVLTGRRGLLNEVAQGRMSLDGAISVREF